MSTWTTEYTGDAAGFAFDDLTIMGTPGHPGEGDPAAPFYDDLQRQLDTQVEQAKAAAHAAVGSLSGDVHVRVTGSLSVPEDPNTVLLIHVEQYVRDQTA